MSDSIDLEKDAIRGPVGLARALSERGRRISSQAVSQWVRVPAGRVLDVEAVTGISRHILRPDIYGPEPNSPREKTKGKAA